MEGAQAQVARAFFLELDKVANDIFDAGGGEDAGLGEVRNFAHGLRVNVECYHAHTRVARAPGALHPHTPL